MNDRINKINQVLTLPGAIISFVAGIVAIYKEVPYYIYIPIFIVAVVCLVVILIRKKEIHDFELVWQDVTIDVLDDVGKDATFVNRSKLRSLKDGSFNYEYILYSDGEISNINTIEGSVSDVHKEGGRLKVLTSIETPIDRGVEIEHTICADFINSFTQKKEYWQSTRNSPGTKLKVTVLVPSSRPIRDFKAYKVIGQSKTLLNEQPKRVFVNGKNGIMLATDEAKLLEQYRLEWTW